MEGIMAKEEISSVFLTPASSNEYLVSNKVKSRVLKDEGSIPCDLEREESCRDNNCDILTRCHEKNLVSVVISKILGKLTDHELLRFSHVNQSWRRIVKIEHMKSGCRLSRYINRAKKKFYMNKENSLRFLKTSASITLTPIQTPTPLSQHNALDEKCVTTAKVCKEEKTPTIVQPTSSNFRHCPGCQSPARTTFQQIGHCNKCDNDFCIHCFFTNNKHSPTCQLVGGSGVSGSMTRKLDKGNSSKKYSIGSTTNKARLKRL